MRLTYKSILSLCLFTLFLSNCENEKKIQITSDAILEKPLERPPEIVPTDAYIHTIVSQENPSWTEMDQYYRNEMMLEKEKPYFDNLQWMTISILIDISDFLQEADVESKVYYLNEMVSRKFVNNPDVAFALLDDLSQTDTNIDPPSYARKIKDINRNNFSSDEDFKKHKERYSSSYVQIMSMGWNRWGQEL